MPLDARAREVAEWLGRARADIRAADVDLAAQPPLLGDAAFHCQQAAEKALKGLLTCNDRVFEKTHDIEPLVIASLEYAPALEPVLLPAVPLTVYAWRFRYPGPIVEPARAEVESALAVARNVVRAVEDIVSDGC
jgi:HEPN domain-containing protein